MYSTDSFLLISNKFWMGRGRVQCGKKTLPHGGGEGGGRAVR
jgi:hypothetical protein